MRKRIFSIVVILAMLAMIMPVITAADRERVTLIVEIEGDAALEAESAVLMGAAEYNDTEEFDIQTAAILSAQESVQSDIKREVGKNADLGFTYTNVINGFSVTVDKSHVDKIKALPNVNGVYAAGVHKYIEPLETETEPFSDDADSSASDNCCQIMNVPYMHARGYKGQGQAIAVIDSELDVNHEFFAASVENPKYSRDDIERLISEKNLNVNVSADEVWRSDKIPFAYNYAKDNPDVYSTFLVHGSHVCGIAAGKDGKRRDGTSFSGVAPEAQIIFMGVLKDSTSLPDDAIIAAIDDASKMDVAAINMSLGADYTYFSGGLGALFEKAISNAVNAGIEVCVASGNAGRTASKVDKIDCSASGLPAAVSPSTSVAASYGSSGKICSFSSWGTNTTLELKPEITASGGGIYSSIPDNKYAVYSGTSMATPHMSGAAALMRQYIEDNYSAKYENGARFIENLTMSGAKIIYQSDNDKIPYSPRNQGAGLIDLKAAATTPVILSGADGKSKISLKDKLTDTFKIEFTARNFTDSPVTYDTVTPTVYTESCIYSEALGTYSLQNKLTPLNFTAEDKPEGVTVPANGETKIEFTVTLDSQETAEYREIFTNGFYIDGFVELCDTSETVPAISIPYTGFYGDWTEMPSFAPPYYTGKDARSGTGLGSHNGKCICSNEAEIPALRPYCEFLGRNHILTEKVRSGEITDGAWDIDEYDGEEFAGISPNGDGKFDFLCVKVVPVRAMEDCSVRIENSLGEVMDVQGEQGGDGGFAILQYGDDQSDSAPPLDKYDKHLINCTDYNDLESLPDGDYTVYVSGRLAYEGAENEEISMKFYVDTEPPEITRTEIREESGKTYLDLSVCDNRYVMGAVVKGKNTDGTDFTKTAYTKADKTGDMTVDITGAGIQPITVTAIDYAYNETVCSLGGRVEFNNIGNVVSARVVFDGVKPSAQNDIQMFVAYRSDGELKRVVIPTLTDMTASFAAPDAYEDFDVYVWDKSMMPLMAVQKANYR